MQLMHTKDVDSRQHCFFLRVILLRLLESLNPKKTHKAPHHRPTWKFPSCFPQNFKMQYNDIGRVQVVWKYPRHDLMSFFDELNFLQVWETCLSFQPQFENSPEFPHGFSFHLQPKFPHGFSPPTTTIPGDSPQNPWDIARWVGSNYF